LDGRPERYLVTGNTFTYLLLGDYRYWMIGQILNRVLQADVIDKYGPPGRAGKKRG
jgi:hypothetical protein